MQTTVKKLDAAGWEGTCEICKYLHFQLKNESKICLKFSVFMRRNEELTPIPILVLSYTFQSHQKLCEQECLLE